MIDPVKILQRAWHILWNYRTLWVFGLILAIASGASSSGNNGGGSRSNVQTQANGPSVQPPSFRSLPEAVNALKNEIHKLFTEGIPQVHITGAQLTSFLWVIVAFIVLMILIGIVIAIARYVSETAVIRMVDEYENSGTKMTVREGFRVGWSRAAWRLFLINLIVNLPAILLFLTLTIAGVIIFLAFLNGRMVFTAAAIVSMVGLTFLAIFVVVILSIFLGLLRYFFWRAAVLEDAGVGESLRRGFTLVRQNWKSVGIMWLVMIGLGIAWIVVSIIAAILTLPVVILTTVLAVVVVAVPGFLLLGLFSLFLGGPLPWIAAALFILPLFFLIAFSPWLILGSWEKIYTSTVWTLTYREIKVLPTTLALPSDLEPVGD